MRADVSSLDWLQTDDTERVYRVDDRHYDSGRSASRVRVKLRVAVAMRQCAFLAETVDISETGILIDNYDGPPLDFGCRVGIMIRGIISDEQADEFWLMRVARCAGARLALSFS